MPNRPLVSVIIPAYRHARYASEAVRCAAEQTLDDIEIIVVDDASGDDTVSRYDFPADVRLVCQPRRSGPSAARNAGVREARGRYIAFLDQDDLWLPNKLEAQVSLLEAHPAAAMTYCHVLYMDEGLNPTTEQKPFEAVTGEDFGDVISHWFAKTCSAVMLRREHLDRAGEMNEDLWIAGDWDLWTRVSLTGPLVPDPEPRVLYRTHAEQLSERRGRMLQETVSFQARWLEWARAERPGSAKRLTRAHVRGLQQYSDELFWSQHRPFRAARILARAIMLGPRDVRSYVRCLKIATAPLNPRFYRRGGNG